MKEDFIEILPHDGELALEGNTEGSDGLGDRGGAVWASGEGGLALDEEAAGAGVEEEGEEGGLSMEGVEISGWRARWYF